MFAVPGWSVSASSLVQEKGNSKASKKDGLEKKSKKRKRDQDVFQLEAPSPPQQQPPITARRDDSKSKARPAGDTGRLISSLSHDRRSHGHDLVRSRKAQKVPEQSATYNASSPLRDKSIDGVPTSTKHSGLLRANPVSQTNAKLTPLQEKMRNKLTSARFRHLNETLYTTSSSDALSLFTNSPEMFAEYHAGFSQQVKDSWPQNPVEGYIKSFRTRGALSEPKQGVMPLPRRKTGSCTVADLGCGDAPLARGCQSVVKTLRLKFHNFDLHAPNTFVTKADISNLPLRDGEADIAVFCLSLMGTNWVSFVEEAWRIVRGDGKGEIWVAEVKSRFGKVTRGRVVENSVGKRRKIPKNKSAEINDDDGLEQFVEDERNANQQEDDTDISNFVKVFTRRGFQLREGSVNKQNKMFVSMVFFKSGIPTAGKHKGLKWNGKEYVKQPENKARSANNQRDDGEITPLEEAKALKPCVYKTR